MKNHQKSLGDKAILDVLALSKDATAIYTTAGIIIEMANDAMIAFWHKDRSVIGKPLIEAVPELEGQEFVKILKEVWRTGISYEASASPAQLMHDGKLETFYFDFVYQAIKHPDGSTYCILHTATDSTAHVLRRNALKKKEVEVQQLSNSLNQKTEDLSEVQTTLSNLYDQVAENESVFRNIFEQAPLGIAMFTGPGQVIQLVNDQILKIWDRTREEVIGKTHFLARPEIREHPMNGWMKDVFNTGRIYTNRELKVSVKSGNGLREAYVNSVYSPVSNAKGEITGVLVTIDEITDRIISRQQAERSQEQLRLAVESAQLGTWSIDADKRVFTASARTKELFGFHADEQMSFEQALGQIVEEHRDRVMRLIDEAIDQGTHYDLEYPILGHRDEKIRWVRATGKRYPGQLGASAQFVGTIQDISDRKKNEQLKNDFIAMVSHELKTPLTTLSGYLQFLHRKAEQAQDTSVINTLKKTTSLLGKMTGMINGFLDVSRMEAGKIRIDLERFNMADLIREVEAALTNEDQTHEIIFEPVEETWLYADEDKIEQVIRNFISNAMKYSARKSQIRVAVQHTKEFVQVSVRDQGMGIHKDDIAQLFDRFYRVENGLTRNIAGFGIGLYICKEIIEGHQGKIWVESEPGKGSTFYFSLPV